MITDNTGQGGKREILIDPVISVNTNDLEVGEKDLWRLSIYVNSKYTAGEKFGWVKICHFGTV